MGRDSALWCFFKGCPLKCKWCANPESQNYDEEIMESPVRCVGCGACRDACPKGAILEDGSIDRTLCDNCMKCIDVCYAEAKKITGRAYTTEELYKEIEKGSAFLLQIWRRRDFFPAENL